MIAQPVSGGDHVGCGEFGLDFVVIVTQAHGVGAVGYGALADLNNQHLLIAGTLSLGQRHDAAHDVGFVAVLDGAAIIDLNRHGAKGEVGIVSLGHTDIAEINHRILCEGQYQVCSIIFPYIGDGDLLGSGAVAVVRHQHRSSVGTGGHQHGGGAGVARDIHCRAVPVPPAEAAPELEVPAPVPVLSGTLSHIGQDHPHAHIAAQEGAGGCQAHLQI